MMGEIKILIIDDCENECKTLKNILEAKGYRTSMAHNGRESIESVKTEPPDLILLDLVFKGDKNGVEIFRDIKKIVPGAKAVLITGYGVEEEHGLVREAWSVEGIVDEFLRKPLGPEEVLKAIVKHTGRI